MNQEAFIRERKAHWEKLYAILMKIERQGIRSLSEADLEAFGFLYRRAASDLAYAKGQGFDLQTVEFLNGLVARTHPLIYAPPPAVLQSLGRFFFAEFPALLRRCRRYLTVSAFLFLGAALLAYLFVISNPYTARSFVPERLLDHVEQTIQENRQTPQHRVGSEAAPVSSFIMTNNIKVAFASFALGVTLGVGTCTILVYNGFLLGGLAGIFDHYGFSLPFWSLILPHGVIELTAIFIAASGGLLLGFTLLAPGDYSRLDALRLAAPQAVKLVMGTLPLFVAAGLIEGFFTPLPVDPRAKLLFSGVAALALVLYFAAGVREKA